MFYERFEKERPVILLDLQRMMLAADYEKAIAKNKIVVFVMLEWVGGEFDPERFDLESVNKKLRRLRTRKS